MWRPVPSLFGGGDDKDSVLPWSSQLMQNWIPSKAEGPGTRSPLILRDAPGLVPIAKLGGAVRGLHDCSGKLLAIGGTDLYQVATNYSVSALDTIPGNGRVEMAHNQITGGNQVQIVNGQAGWIYNTVTGSVVKITDDGFPGAITTDYIESRFINIEPGRRFWCASDLADGTSYNTNLRYESSASPDLLRALIVNHLEILAFNETTLEVFENTGQEDDIFDSKQIVIERGAASSYAIALLDNSAFFLGNDGIVYRLDGYSPQRISTASVEQALSKATDLTTAFAFTFEDRGHKIFYLTVPGLATFGYDVATQLWHRRVSHGMKTWRITQMVRWNNQWIGGDADGFLYRLDWDYKREGPHPLVRWAGSGVLHNNGNRVTLSGVRLEMDTGGPASTTTYNSASPPVKLPVVT